MPITEATKRAVSRLKDSMRAKRDALMAEKQAHQDSITAIDAKLVALKTERDALTADIPEPDPVEEPV